VPLPQGPDFTRIACICARLAASNVALELIGKLCGRLEASTAMARARGRNTRFPYVCVDIDSARKLFKLVAQACLLPRRLF
jgi:hypothetical protein